MTADNAGRDRRPVAARLPLITETNVARGTSAREREEAARRAHRERLRGDARRRATIRLDEVVPAPQRAARVPSTFGLSDDALAREITRLLTSGGVDLAPAPWSRAEVARVLVIPRRAS